ncbi:hypothetical protein RND81_05G165500 [Saponaria officinalis]|uniref:Dilute domain-containing protein n=1 Tax=Saponaria officinalis TaxID=3572 RepID=A0AAW1KWK4_SAPOF
MYTMKETERKKVQNNNQTKRPARTPRRESKIGEENGRKSVSKETKSKPSRARLVANNVESDVSLVTDPSEVYENVVIHYADDPNRSEDSSTGFRKDVQKAMGDDSDYESLKDSSSSQGDSVTVDDEKLETDLGVSRKLSKKSSSERNKSGVKQSNPTVKKPVKSDNVKLLEKDVSENGRSSGMKVHPASESSEEIDKKSIEEEKDEDVFEEASNGGKSMESYDENIEIMEKRIEKLEDELREVAALEISLYSVIPEHGSSSHKVHTPARRLSRLYIHACKHWSRSKRAAIARNTVSGIILVAKTCGNDLARLTFWHSNTVVLRAIISQAFSISSIANGSQKASKGNVSAPKSMGHGKQLNKTSDQSFEDWGEMSTFTSALEKVESWIFSRVVESVWWQALTPNMLSPVEELIRQKSIGKLLGPALGDQQQGTFSIELWKNAFQTAFQRLCPVRGAGHECGCLPVLARMVMEQCVARLDVAMFNAILRESADQIPTDPVSDPIVDSRVLPIPAGEFSFGSGAQLKNAVGNWSRWFEDTIGVETGHFSEDHDSEANDDHPGSKTKTECFRLLNELGDLLMLPKDLLMDSCIREEVCPSINLDVIKRILCYFTPDEFCPDPVPGEVLESLNAESFVEQRLAGISAGSFPYGAATVQYSPPSANDVSEKVAEAGGNPHLDRNVSMVQKKGYTSDEELDDLDSPLTFLVEPSTLVNGKSRVKDKEWSGYGGNARYELLRQVWSL